MKNAVIIGLLSVLALAVVGTVGSVSFFPASADHPTTNGTIAEDLNAIADALEADDIENAKIHTELALQDGLQEGNVTNTTSSGQ